MHKDTYLQKKSAPYLWEMRDVVWIGLKDQLNPKITTLPGLPQSLHHSAVPVPAFPLNGPYGHVTVNTFTH